MTAYGPLFNVAYRGTADDAADVFDSDNPPDELEYVRAGLTNALRKIALLEKGEAAYEVRIANLEQRAVLVGERIANADRRLIALYRRAADFEGAIKHVNGALERIIDLGASLETRVGATASASADVGEILKAALGRIEANFETVREAITALERRADRVDSNLSTGAEDVGDLLQRIRNLETHVDERRAGP